MEIPTFLCNSPLSVFTLFYASAYLFGYFIVFRRWGKECRSEASSCLMSLAHGTPAVFLAIFSILKSQTSITRLEFASPNTYMQNMVLEYSIAYFLMDLLHYLFLVPCDILFIMHHLATLYVLITCRYLFYHGAVAILAILVLAEVTAACQNTWSLARFREKGVPDAAGLYEFLSPIFYAYYTVVRGFLGPLFVYKIGVFFATGVGDGVIPRWGWISWITVTVSAIVLSILWVLHLWIDLYTRRRKKELKKFN